MRVQISETETEEWTWAREDGPMDIWVRESEFTAMKQLIAMGRWMEYRMWFTPTETEEEYINKITPTITLNDLLNMQGGMFGNNPNRSITIIKNDNTIERWVHVCPTQQPNQ